MLAAATPCQPSKQTPVHPADARLGNQGRSGILPIAGAAGVRQHRGMADEPDRPRIGRSTGRREGGLRDARTAPAIGAAGRLRCHGAAVRSAGDSAAAPAHRPRLLRLAAPPRCSASPGWLGGVSAGIDARLGIDPIIVRGDLVVGAVLGARLRAPLRHRVAAAARRRRAHPPRAADARHRRSGDRRHRGHGRHRAGPPRAGRLARLALVARVAGPLVRRDRRARSPARAVGARDHRGHHPARGLARAPGRPRLPGRRSRRRLANGFRERRRRPGEPPAACGHGCHGCHDHRAAGARPRCRRRRDRRVAGATRGLAPLARRMAGVAAERRTRGTRPRRPREQGQGAGARRRVRGGQTHPARRTTAGQRRLRVHGARPRPRQRVDRGHHDARLDRAPRLRACDRHCRRRPRARRGHVRGRGAAPAKRIPRLRHGAHDGRDARHRGRPGSHHRAAHRTACPSPSRARTSNRSATRTSRRSTTARAPRGRPRSNSRSGPAMCTSRCSTTPGWCSTPARPGESR